MTVPDEFLRQVNFSFLLIPNAGSIPAGILSPQEGNDSIFYRVFPFQSWI
jgi:hypothetical protein